MGLENMKRKISLPMALAAMLATGFALGRWSSQLPGEGGAVLVQSNIVRSDAESLEDVAITRTPSTRPWDSTAGLGGRVLENMRLGNPTGRKTDRQVALDFSAQELNNDDAQIFSFFMGFTR